MPRSITESFLRSNLTVGKYETWLKHNFPKSEPSCGTHMLWLYNVLGIQAPEYSHHKIIHTSDIPNILNTLDKGAMIEFLHDYKNRMITGRLAKDNIYGNHTFAILKAGDKYFVTQGFMYAYKHSLISYTRDEIEQMLGDIIDKLCDYENKKTWADADLSLFKKYFRTELFFYPKRRVKLSGRMHNVVLRMEVHFP